MNSLIQQLTPGRRETPGPHRLQPKGQRQEDLEHQEKIRQQEDGNVASTNTSNPDQVAGLEFIKLLASTITQHQQSDTNEPAKCNGQDQHWDEFYNQLRSYLAAKNWLTTFDHPTGPGTQNFDNGINTKIYTKLTMLCH